MTVNTMGDQTHDVVDPQLAPGSSGTHRAWLVSGRSGTASGRMAA